MIHAILSLFHAYHLPETAAKPTYAPFIHCPQSSRQQCGYILHIVTLHRSPQRRADHIHTGDLAKLARVRSITDIEPTSPLYCTQTHQTCRLYKIHSYLHVRKKTIVMACSFFFFHSSVCALVTTERKHTMVTASQNAPY